MVQRRARLDNRDQWCIDTIIWILRSSCRDKSTVGRAGLAGPEVCFIHSIARTPCLEATAIATERCRSAKPRLRGWPQASPSPRTGRNWRFRGRILGLRSVHGFPDKRGLDLRSTDVDANLRAGTFCSKSKSISPKLLPLARCQNEDIGCLRLWSKILDPAGRTYLVSGKRNQHQTLQMRLVPA